MNKMRDVPIRSTERKKINIYVIDIDINIW